MKKLISSVALIATMALTDVSHAAAAEETDLARDLVLAFDGFCFQTRSNFARTSELLETEAKKKLSVDDLQRFGGASDPNTKVIAGWVASSLAGNPVVVSLSEGIYLGASVKMCSVVGNFARGKLVAEYVKRLVGSAYPHTEQQGFQTFNMFKSRSPADMFYVVHVYGTVKETEMFSSIGIMVPSDQLD
ncbi:hypothetical protein [Mesorhizobium sp. B1-1-6]|uniref:hypothetical protein n=1 Tax=Mesorhizobium sp. B1-1-6 TaxID=2589978 RepID=UPI00112BAFC8|nr:hypothetical protein [Mesorhizobium sp. B1-1-6]TPN41380.1 hypothetical protein FJ979_04485 [Mesorhizobium sp. B1-1-6]